MLKLEDLKKGARVEGVTSSGSVEIVDVAHHGPDAREFIYKKDDGTPGIQIIYRDQESDFTLVESGRYFGFEADGALFRLASEAYRIRLAHLFDPHLAIHISNIEPLPHQIMAVYDDMLSRQPLRFLLADDPGAGKTIMAGLLIQELLIRGDLKRCLICCPGNLVDQWQDELRTRFDLSFEIISNQSIEDSPTGNPYREKNLVISRLDHMSRNEHIQALLEDTEWDLVVVDEAHKMSAHFSSNEIKKTKRYELGQIITAPERTRQLLLMTATPHSGKEADFQLFLALIDQDRFEGHFRDGVHTANVADIMRRVVKEQMFKMDGTPLFPERRAYTATYELSDLEAKLYEEVTTYVREEMNRADELGKEGEGRRGNRVGFALTSLQRRLASSPEAIYISLKRRRERLEKRLSEERLLDRGASVRLEEDADLKRINDSYLAEDIDDAPEREREDIEQKIVEQASAASTIIELGNEIERLKELEAIAEQVRRSGDDRKWKELSELFGNTPEMRDADKKLRKLIIFTEHKDTLHYLSQKIRTYCGTEESVVNIHGGMGREERRNIQERFCNDPDVHVLVATDAAGEGINLQHANLVINYDLPWNPNRLEQRFGRVHRIGQVEVCHMWSLIAQDTREGEVFLLLLRKLEAEREALGGGVFDVLGRLFAEIALRDLLIDAIRYGNLDEVKARMRERIENPDKLNIKLLLDEHALNATIIDKSTVTRLKADMDRIDALRLQPHFIQAFFIEAFKVLGGSIHMKEPNRFEITNVPLQIRERDRHIGVREVIQQKYQRICFEREDISIQGKPKAAFVCPGHPLLNATIDLILEKYRNLLKNGAVLVDTEEEGKGIRALFYLENSIQDGREIKEGTRLIISKQLLFAEMDEDGSVWGAGPAPYLDYRPATPEEIERIRPKIEAQWLSGTLESRVVSYALSEIVPEHLKEVKSRREILVNKTRREVKDRLTKEINYWDHRANELKAMELAGKRMAKLNSAYARRRADDLTERLRRRLAELDLELKISALPPLIIGGALVVPASMLESPPDPAPGLHAHETAKVQRIAMEKVMATERAGGFEPTDVEIERVGYDIRSINSSTQEQKFIEVKGRVRGATAITVTRNEVLTCLNKPDKYWLALVLIENDVADEPNYLLNPFREKPDFGVTSVNYEIGKLFGRDS